MESDSWGQPLTFSFGNGTPFDDNAGVGASVVASDGASSVRMTTVDILAPEYEEFPEDSDFMVPTGATLSATSGGEVTTNIVSNNTLGIDNPSITNLQYNQSFGTTLNESANFNKDEAWVFEFDMDVQIVELNFSALDDEDQFSVTVAGVGATFVFDNGETNDDFEDPLGDLVILSGTNITLKSTGQANGTVRIAEISVLPMGGPGGPLIGDYNGDFKVSAADYTVWRDTFGSEVDPGDGADGDFNGRVDALDFEVWKDSYGPSLQGMSLTAAILVPEPEAAVIGIAALLIIATVKRPCGRQIGCIR